MKISDICEKFGLDAVHLAFNRSVQTGAYFSVYLHKGTACVCGDPAPTAEQALIKAIKEAKTKGMIGGPLPVMEVSGDE